MIELALSLAVGLFIGLALGALGGGGSVLTVPALVYILGQSGQHAATASLVIVGITSLISMINYARDHQVRWRSGIAFGAAGVASSYLGTLTNRQVPEPVLLLSFAVLMLVVGTVMIAKSRNSRRSGGDARAHQAGDQPERARMSTTVAQVIIAGLVVGFLTGFLGVGGGFLIVPALIFALRLPMITAVGTSLLIITINSASSLLARLHHPDLNAHIIVPITVAAVVASLAGKLIASRIPSHALSRAFAVLVIAVGLYMGVRVI